MARPDVASGKGTRTEEEQRSLVAAQEVYAGRYAVLREIGRGGMGRVLLARDLKLSRHVAVKVLPTGAHDPHQLERFDKEARAAGCLNHPNVVDVHDVGEHEGEPSSRPRVRGRRGAAFCRAGVSLGAADVER